MARGWVSDGSDSIRRCGVSEDMCVPVRSSLESHDGLPKIE